MAPPECLRRRPNASWRLFLTCSATAAAACLRGLLAAVEADLEHAAQVRSDDENVSFKALCSARFSTHEPRLWISTTLNDTVPVAHFE